MVSLSFVVFFIPVNVEYQKNKGISAKKLYMFISAMLTNFMWLWILSTHTFSKS